MAQSPALVQEGSTPSARDTRERLLDAAERLFGENGFDGTSMRALARAAGTGLSAANYHFGSKEALLTAVMRRRINPVNELRIQRLEALEAGSGRAPLPVEAVVDAYLRPVFEVRAASIQRSPTSPWLAARIYSDPSQEVTKLKRELFVDVQARFLPALQRALPQRDPRDLAIAQQLTTGLLVHVLSGNLSSEDFAAPDGAHDYEPILRQLVAFATAGLTSAPRTSTPQSGSGEQRP